MKAVVIILVVQTCVWAQYIRDDGMPIIFGADGDSNLAKASGPIVVSPHSTQQQQQQQQQQQRSQVVRPQLQQVVQPATPQQHFFDLPPVQPVPPSVLVAQPLQPTFPEISTQFALSPAPLCDAFDKPLVDEVESGRAYHLSWCHDSGRTYTWEHASRYCAALGHGFQALSIETQPEQHFIATIIVKHYIQDIWTSGNKVNSRYWSWLSGAAMSYTNWSRTGRRGVPQPDNTDGNEDCLAVFNNHFNDGVVWHDSSCFLQRRVICEARQFYGA
ncbi:uncharacterized protein [Procambarus clarkii]|uniref:uncharacterized protein n=1 Tax=Procambarus clarkii TaxID=6728 RepID=UPI003744A383